MTGGNISEAVVLGTNEERIRYQILLLKQNGQEEKSKIFRYL